MIEALSVKAGARLAAMLALAATALGMAACAQSVRVVDRPSGPLPWSAAIGRLDSEEARGSCSATLVRPDMILTASHCLYGRGTDIRIIDFAFTPALDVGRERLRAIPVSAVIAMGWPVTPDASGDLGRLPLQDDWAILRLAQPIDFIEPLPVEQISIADIETRLASGATLSHAGFGVYGAGSGKRLQIRDHCQLVAGDDDERIFHDVIKNTCLVIKGDSGGPILLTEPSGARSVVGIITRFWQSESGANTFSLGPSAVNFSGEIGAPAAKTDTVSAP